MPKNPKQITPTELNRWLSTSTSPQPFLVDVREDEELELAPFTYPVKHLALSKATSWTDQLQDLLPQNQPIIAICHAGVRSMQFSTWLLNQGWQQDVYNLEGGIDAWSLTVDHTVPRY